MPKRPLTESVPNLVGFKRLFKVGGKMFGRRNVSQQPSIYATESDFCRIFEKDMSSLYLLSLLLAGDRTTAEECFVGGLHIAQEGNQVFNEWAESWARRAIIQNAIRMLRPRKAADATDSTVVSNSGSALMEHREIAVIVALPAFERFAFVMSVLEHCSDQECSLLLGCTRGDVAEARTRALERLGKSADHYRKVMGVGSNREARSDNSESALQMTAAHSLAASA
jgi:DNA-directed RNA polymerase specialized sigma24 family protein